ncbi:hypothetical protein FBU30_002311 [Linnemannia zychae]|nr:hypothetical protein FBU30_002311 [Linnemannia zychae]
MNTPTIPQQNTSSSNTGGGNVAAPTNASANSASTSATRFDFRKESIQELILLRALALHRPFVAPHGSGTEAWNKLVDYLHETDRSERPTSPFFTNVKVRSCKLAWDRLFNEQKAYEASLLTATGISPEETERRRLMKELNALKTAGAEAIADARQERNRQQEAQAEERRLGQLLLESAESLSAKTRNGASDSESSSTSFTANTKYNKRRLMLQNITKQQQDAVDYVKGQTDLLAQQLALQREQLELRKKTAERNEILEREKEIRAVNREREREERHLEWEREKLRETQRREKEREDRHREAEEHRHKEVMELYKQQAATNQLLAQLLVNLHQKMDPKSS